MPNEDKFPTDSELPFEKAARSKATLTRESNGVAKVTTENMLTDLTDQLMMLQEQVDSHIQRISPALDTYQPTPGDAEKTTDNFMSSDVNMIIFRMINLAKGIRYTLQEANERVAL